MFDLAAFSADSFWAFLQVFVRVSSLFVSARPVFGSREIPMQVKAGLAARSCPWSCCRWSRRR